MCVPLYTLVTSWDVVKPRGIKKNTYFQEPHTWEKEVADCYDRDDKKEDQPNHQRDNLRSRKLIPNYSFLF